MVGRYGQDHLGVAIMIASLVVYAISIITRLASLVLVSSVLFVISFLMVVVALARMLSRNIPRRRAENDRFIRYWWPVRMRMKNARSDMMQHKTHRFFRCKSCRNRLRVPRGKGKLHITCPKCGERFIKKT
jgi:predicted RNA-binding Zn-ribbon protein involved in translation (DUF1610 family)